MSDDFLKGKIRDRSGEEIGTWESIIDGRLMTTVCETPNNLLSIK